MIFRFFQEFEADDFARSGQEANEEVVLKQGPLPQFSHSIEPQLRSLGLPTKLEKG
jgi:mRNA turnover protein 4